jgi:hypothetical protein
MIREQYPTMNNELDYDPESSMFCVRSSNLDALKIVYECIRDAISDEKVLQAAIDKADPSIME